MTRPIDRSFCSNLQPQPDDRRWEKFTVEDDDDKDEYDYDMTRTDPS